MVAIARIRKAAKDLKQQGKHVTKMTLATQLQVPFRKVRSVLDGSPWFAEEIDLITNQEAIKIDYLFAAQRLRAANLFVTLDMLATTVDKSHRAVRTYFQRNRAFAAQVGLLWPVEAKRLERRKKYSETAQKLLSNSEKVTIIRVAVLCRIDRFLIYRDIKRDPSIAKILQAA
jgi:hypothetical protein